LCHEHGIEHRLTRGNHPWTNDQVERMNRPLKEATVKKYHYQTHQHLKEHLHAFLMASLPSASKLSEVSPLTNTSVTAGRKSQNALESIHAITPWD
jgi:transposase InsO family protein